MTIGLSEVTITETLKAAGYMCWSIGRWYLGPARLADEAAEFIPNTPSRQKNPTHAAVRRVIAEPGAQRPADDTMVIFTPDNGGVDAVSNESPEDSCTSNYPLRAGECWPYEGALRVPAIARWPGYVKPGVRHGEPARSVGWKPTICEAAGVPIPTGCGNSALPGSSTRWLPIERTETRPSQETL